MGEVGGPFQGDQSMSARVGPPDQGLNFPPPQASLPAQQQAPWQPTPPPPAMAPAAPEGNKGGRRWLKIVLIVGGLLLVALLGIAALGVGWLYWATSMVDDNVPAHAWLDECYSDDGSYQPVDCNGPHHFEVYSAAEFPADTPYPSVLDRGLGLDICDEDFETYTGESYFDLTSDYDYQVRYPSEEAWDDGNRIALCVLVHGDLTELDGPAGSWPGS